MAIWTKLLRATPKSLSPDVSPSSFGLSTVHGDSYLDLDNGRTEWFNTIKLTGHAYARRLATPL